MDDVKKYIEGMESCKHFIEFRVYLKDKVTAEEIHEIADAAEDLCDKIGDIVSDEMSPVLFTEDVSYEVKFRDISPETWDDLARLSRVARGIEKGEIKLPESPKKRKE